MGNRDAMRDRPPPRCTILGLIAMGALALFLAACAESSLPSERATAAAHLLTARPGMAATLTSWPTPPPLVTRAPTPSAEPQPLWTAEPEVTGGAAPGDETAAAPPALLPDLPAGAPGSQPGSGAPAVRLLIDRLGLDVPVVEVSWVVIAENGAYRSVWQTADGAAGHHRNSANPGEAGNVVISGHHNTRGEVFRQVSDIGLPGSELAVGDEVTLVAQDGQQYGYEIVFWDRFEEETASDAEQRQHAAYLAATGDARLTLVTCWPYEANSHRVVVIAKLRP